MSTVGDTPRSSQGAPPELINRQRIPTTLDPLSVTDSSLTNTLLPFRTAAITKIYLAIKQVQSNLQLIAGALATRTVPQQIIGLLQQPDGTAASRVQVEFDPATLNSNSPPVTVLTDDTGSFQLTMPPSIALTDAGITLTVHGSNDNAQVTIPATQIASNGLVGAVTLPEVLSPLPVSILAALQALVPTTLPTTTPAPQQNPPQLPAITLGEDGSCQLSFGANNTVDSFPFGVFFRLVEPRLSIVNQGLRFPLKEGNGFFVLPTYETAASAVVAQAQTLAGSASAAVTAAVDGTPSTEIVPAFPSNGNLTLGEGFTTFVDRVPVEQPLSIDGFRDQLMGLTPGGVFTADETVPMAATLGLGYVLWMSQQWTFEGVTLGDLVYSLPLAPGEQEEVAVFERVDTASVTESEFFSEQEAQTQAALSDTSTQATFNSAFNESASGGSAFSANSNTSSWGGSILIASGGGGSTSSSGSSSEWLQGQRDSAQQAAETTHSAAERQASARRSAARTSMRLATASESESVTTKVITNHNHTRALTMQYWQVERLYDVTTAIDGVTLTCLVPLQLVRFMPPGQPLSILSTSITQPQDVLNRYSSIIKHIDVLEQALPRKFQYGLTLLRQFASDPTAKVEAFGGTAEDVIQFYLSGTFLPCEDIYITAITNRNTRVGPVRLAPSSATPIPPIKPDTYTSRDDLMAYLSGQRQGAVYTLMGNLALPTSMNRSDIIGFEISRSFRQVNYTLYPAELAALQSVNTLFGSFTESIAAQAIQSTLSVNSSARTTIHLLPTDLESALGGPSLFNFQASIIEFDANAGSPFPAPIQQPPAQGETYANDSLYGVELPPQPYPVPAIQIGPVLRFNEILEIEQMAQHVVRNTLLYSKAIWASMTADERAVLLDSYTIGVPPGGITDESQMVPLLNCVENRLLGFFGNSMILPFIIPQSVADEMKIDPAKIQQALLSYQQATFDPPHSTIALPTRGVLGEAVLGHCPSAEKIDLTRFWNWSDSPGDTAPTISPTLLPTSSASIAAGLTAPNTLTTLPSLINNVLNAPTPDSSLLQALSKAAAAQQDFSSSLTGAAQLTPLITNAQNTANAARADALKTTKDLQSQAMATVGNIVGGIYGGNPNAGSSAASAVNGTGSSSSASKSGAQSKGTSSGSNQSSNQPSSGGNGSGDSGSGSTGTGDSGTGTIEV